MCEHAWAALAWLASHHILLSYDTQWQGPEPNAHEGRHAVLPLSPGSLGSPWALLWDSKHTTGDSSNPGPTREELRGHRTSWTGQREGDERPFRLPPNLVGVQPRDALPPGSPSLTTREASRAAPLQGQAHSSKQAGALPHAPPGGDAVHLGSYLLLGGWAPRNLGASYPAGMRFLRSVTSAGLPPLYCSR